MISGYISSFLRKNSLYFKFMGGTFRFFHVECSRGHAQPLIFPLVLNMVSTSFAISFCFFFCPLSGLQMRV